MHPPTPQPYPLSLHDALPISKFTAESYDPDSWVRLFEQAGAQYFTLTSKHHDGFALFPSKVTGRHAGRIGPQRRSEEHTSELQSHSDLVCRLLLEKKKTAYR